MGLTDELFTIRFYKGLILGLAEVLQGFILGFTEGFFIIGSHRGILYYLGLTEEFFIFEVSQTILYNSLPYEILVRRIARYHDVLRGTTRYYEVLRRIIVLRRATRYYDVLRGTATYCEVLRRTTRYLDAR